MLLLFVIMTSDRIVLLSLMYCSMIADGLGSWKWRFPIVGFLINIVIMYGDDDRPSDISMEEAEVEVVADDDALDSDESRRSRCDGDDIRAMQRRWVIVMLLSWFDVITLSVYLGVVVAVEEEWEEKRLLLDSQEKKNYVLEKDYEI